MSEEEVRVGDYVWINGLRDEVAGFHEDRGTRLSSGRWICASKLRLLGHPRHLGGRTWSYEPDFETSDAEALERCRRGHARQVVAAAAKALGLDLSKDKIGRDVWGPANMQRLVYLARGVMTTVEAQKQYIAKLEAELDRITEPESARALHAALIRDALQASISTRGL